MTPARLEELRQMAGAVDGPKSAWMDDLIEEIDRLKAEILCGGIGSLAEKERMLKERDALRAENERQRSENTDLHKEVTEANLQVCELKETLLDASRLLALFVLKGLKPEDVKAFMPRVEALVTDKRIEECPRMHASTEICDWCDPKKRVEKCPKCDLPMESEAHREECRG